MKVHFIASRISLEQDIVLLRQILDEVRDCGHELARDWVDEAYGSYEKSGQVSEEWAKIVRASVETIAKSDVIIAETSYDSFAVGYQVATAIHQKKPVLLLRHTEANKDAFVNGVEDGWALHKQYKGGSDLKEIIEKFLDENDIKSKDMRFNFFIDRKIYNYLRWAALRTGKTKAEILRDLVEKEIDRESS